MVVSYSSKENEYDRNSTIEDEDKSMQNGKKKGRIKKGGKKQGGEGGREEGRKGRETL